MKPVKVSVIGLGFVGLTLAVMNAVKGFPTIGIDNDVNKLRLLEKKQTYFFEPKLNKYLKRALDSKNLIFSKNLNDIINSDITFLTVGTPSSKKGQIDLSQLKEVVSELSSILKEKNENHLLVIKSTVVPTTTLNEILPVFKNLKNVEIIVNPEFLREGNAINDLLKPHLIVVGYENKNHSKKLLNYYKKFYKLLPEIMETNLTTAEMIKYSNNSFLATKISFINSIANICQKIPNVNIDDVASAIGKDPRIGSQFLKAGPGFGGSCLPKDLSALISFSEQFGNINHLLKTVKEVNDSQYLKIIEMMKTIKVIETIKTISVLGLSFKKDTDDIRESIAIKLVEYLNKNKVKVKVHDPMAMKNFQKIFNKKIQYCETIPECLLGSNCCVLLTEWDEYKKLKPKDFHCMNELNVIDTRRILDHTKFISLNYQAIGIGN